MTEIATGAIRTVTAAHDGMIVTGTVTAALVAMTAEMTEIVTVALAAMTVEMGAETAETTGGGATIGVRTMITAGRHPKARSRNLLRHQAPLPCRQTLRYLLHSTLVRPDVCGECWCCDRRITIHVKSQPRNSKQLKRRERPSKRNWRPSGGSTGQRRQRQG